jgi:hypothetical protein
MTLRREPSKFLSPESAFDPDDPYGQREQTAEFKASPHWAGIVFFVNDPTSTRHGCCTRLRHRLADPGVVACAPFVYRQGERRVEPHFYVPTRGPDGATTLARHTSTSTFSYANTRSVPCLLPVTRDEAAKLFEYLEFQAGAPVDTGGWGLGWLRSVTAEPKTENLALLQEKLAAARHPEPPPRFEIGTADEETTPPAERDTLLAKAPFPIAPSPPKTYLRAARYSPTEPAAEILK